MKLGGHEACGHSCCPRSTTTSCRCIHVAATIVTPCVLGVFCSAHSHVSVCVASASQEANHSRRPYTTATPDCTICLPTRAVSCCAALCCSAATRGMVLPALSHPDSSSSRQQHWLCAGIGKACVGRVEMFRLQHGVAVELTQRVYDVPSLNGESAGVTDWSHASPVSWVWVACALTAMPTCASLALTEMPPVLPLLSQHHHLCFPRQ